MYFPGTSGGWRALAFGDKDGDDDLDMMTKNVITGEDYGNLRYYRNEGTVYNPVMVLQDNLLLPGFYFYQGAPFLVDIDNDTDLDLFVGHSDGGVMFFSNLEVNSVSSHVSLQPSSFILNPCYPNPFNPATTISFTLNRALPVKLSVHNQLGQEVTTIINNQMSPGSYRFNWDALNFSSGVYLISLESNLGIQQTQKVILVK
jgi:hypothetical protein